MPPLLYQIERVTAHNLDLILENQTIPSPGDFLACFSQNQQYPSATYQVDSVEPLSTQTNQFRIRCLMITGHPQLPFTKIQALTTQQFFNQVLSKPQKQIAFNFENTEMDLSQLGQIVWLAPHPSQYHIQLLEAFANEQHPLVIIDPVGMDFSSQYPHIITPQQRPYVLGQDIAYSEWVNWVVANLPEMIQQDCIGFLYSILPNDGNNWISPDALLSHPNWQAFLYGQALAQNIQNTLPYLLRQPQNNNSLAGGNSLLFDLTQLPSDIMPMAYTGSLNQILRSQLPANYQIVLIAPEVCESGVQNFLKHCHQRSFLLSKRPTPWQQIAQDTISYEQTANESNLTLQGQMTNGLKLVLNYSQGAPSGNHPDLEPLIDKNEHNIEPTVENQMITPPAELPTEIEFNDSTLEIPEITDEAFNLDFETQAEEQEITALENNEQQQEETASETQAEIIPPLSQEDSLAIENLLTQLDQNTLEIDTNPSTGHSNELDALLFADAPEVQNEPLAVENKSSSDDFDLESLLNEVKEEQDHEKAIQAEKANRKPEIGLADDEILNLLDDLAEKSPEPTNEPLLQDLFIENPVNIEDLNHAQEFGTYGDPLAQQKTEDDEDKAIDLLGSDLDLDTIFEETTETMQLLDPEWKATKNANDDFGIDSILMEEKPPVQSSETSEIPTAIDQGLVVDFDLPPIAASSSSDELDLSGLDSFNFDTPLEEVHSLDALPIVEEQPPIKMETEQENTLSEFGLGDFDFDLDSQPIEQPIAEWVEQPLSASAPVTDFETLENAATIEFIQENKPELLGGFELDFEDSLNSAFGSLDLPGDELISGNKPTEDAFMLGESHDGLFPSSTQNITPSYSKPEPSLIDSVSYQEGEMVEHPLYGKGKIQKIMRMAQDQQILNIQFEGYGKRLLDPELCELKKLSPSS